MMLKLDNIPAELDAALQRRAQHEGNSVDQVALDALKAGMGIAAPMPKRRDLSDLAGSWVEDPEFDRVMQEQDQIDPDMWKSGVRALRYPPTISGSPPLPCSTG